MIREKFNPSPAQINAAEVVFLAMAHLALVKPIVEAYQRVILARHQWPVAPLMRSLDRLSAPEVVLDPKHSYLLSAAHSGIYFRECRKAREAAGLTVEDVDHCPALVAEEDLRKAKRALVDSLAPITGIGAKEIIEKNFSKYEDFVELSLKLMSPFCNPQQRLERICQEAAIERPRG